MADIPTPKTPIQSGTNQSSSTTGFLKESYKNLPPFTRGVLTIALVAGGVYVGYKILKKIGKITGGVLDSKTGSQQAGRFWDQDVERYNQNPATKATISKAQALEYANAIHAAMDGYGTDEDAILAYFEKLKNNADFALLQSAYGTRTVSSGNWNPAPDFTGSLIAALTDELDQYYKQKINNIMGVKNIKYRV